jgi:hypothetical protein
MRGISLLCCICFLVPFWAFAQGEIEDTQIEIRKDIAIKLPEVAKPVDKINTPLKPIAPEPQTYSYTDYKLNLPDVDSKVKVITIKPDPLNQLYATRVSAGMGTYFTTYLEAWHTAKRSDKTDYGVHFKHLAAGSGPSSVNKSGSGTNRLEAYTRYFNQKYIVTGDLMYNRERFNFYGYRFNGQEKEISDDSIRQVFNTIRFRASISNNTSKDKFQYQGGIEFHNLTTAFDANESEFIIKGEGSYPINKESFISFGTENSIIQYKDTTAQSRVLLQFRPAYNYTKGNLNIKAGINIASDNDSLAESNAFRVYPNVVANYSIIPQQLTVFGGITGDTRKRTLKSLTAENPWLGVKTVISNQDEKINIYAGLKGSTKAGLSWSLQGGYQSVSNFLVYLNTPTDSAKFSAVYDRGNTSIVNVNGSLGYDHKSGFMAGLNLNYNNFTTDKLKAAYHIPAFQTALSVGYLHKNKIGANLNLTSYSKMKTLSPTTGTEVDLKGFVDLDLKITYHLSDRGNVFILADNLLSQKNERYLYYQTRGIMLMIGGNYSF